jgi:hypothetical protein
MSNSLRDENQGLLDIGCLERPLDVELREDSGRSPQEQISTLLLPLRRHVCPREKKESGIESVSTAAALFKD